MIEARITCLTAEYTVADLGITLNRGDELFIEEAKARGSRDLKLARRAGAVRVAYVQRYTMTNPTPPRHLPPFTRMTRAGFKGQQSPQPAADGSPPPTREVSSDARIAHLEAQLAAVQTAIAKLPAEVARAIGTLPAAPAAPGRGPVPRAVEHDEPVFVPSDIVKKDAPAPSITVEQSAGGGDDLDAAAAALKKARAGKRAAR